MADQDQVFSLEPGTSRLTTHAAEMLFAESAATIVADVDGDGIADAPPPESGYRPADIEAVACWNCSHFQRTGLGDDNWPVGICHLWEAQVQGEAVCDKFTADSTMRPHSPHQSASEEVEEGESDEAGFALAEVFMPAGEIEFSDSDGTAVKTIMRTGEWKKTPFSTGVVHKPLKVVRDGASSLAKRVISLTEIVKNFKDGAYENVMIPLSDESRDHPRKGGAQMMKINTGFVRDLWLEDDDEGGAKLRARVQFTEPEVREKVRNGTYPDVSAGIFFDVVNTAGERFNAALNHVCLTPKPFISGLGGFEFAEGEEPKTIESLVPAEEENSYQWDQSVSFSQIEKGIEDALRDQLGLGDHYVVTDVAPDRAIVMSEIAEMSWVVTFSADENGITLAPTTDWHEQAIEASAEDEQPVEPAAAPEAEAPSGSPLQQARRLRELRSRSDKQPEGGGVLMGQVADLNGIDFADPEKAKEAVGGILEENQRLRSQSKKGEITAKVERLKEMGFSEMPGFLAEYRDILLSDDGEPAMVLLSHDDDQNETGRTTLTATEIADRLIAAIPTDKEGKILFSGQALDTGTTERPSEEEEKPADEGADERSVEERTQAAGAALGVDVGGAGKEGE